MLYKHTYTVLHVYTASHILLKDFVVTSIHICKTRNVPSLHSMVNKLTESSSLFKLLWFLLISIKSLFWTMCIYPKQQTAIFMIDFPLCSLVEVLDVLAPL